MEEGLVVPLPVAAPLVAGPQGDLLHREAQFTQSLLDKVLAETHAVEPLVPHGVEGLSQVPDQHQDSSGPQQVHHGAQGAPVGVPVLTSCLGRQEDRNAVVTQYDAR